MVKTLIIDDNKIARTTLRQLCSQVKNMEVTGECADALEAQDHLRRQPVDLLLLDIEMPGMSGLELTRALGDNRPLIVFTTSKNEYAVEAFELNVADYIVKPVTPARFMQAMEKVNELLDSRAAQVQMNSDAFIFIRDSGVVRRLETSDILFAEAMGDYVKLHTQQKFYAVHTTLKAVEERLPQNNFLRVHRSYIVSLGRIDTIRDGAIFINGKTIPVADAYRSVLNKRMNIL